MVVKIKRSSLQDLLSNKENGKNTSSSSSRRRQRAKPNYRRFCAVSSFGNLNALAAAAKQTLLDGEEHFGNTLSAVNEKSKQGKRRVELRQQQFAWEEEHRSLTNERMTLEREILEIVGKVSTTGLSGPLDEMKNAQDITQTAGVAVTQTDGATGTLKTALTGTGMETVVIEAASGVTFLDSANIVIGTGPGNIRCCIILMLIFTSGTYRTTSRLQCKLFTCNTDFAHHR